MKERNGERVLNIGKDILIDLSTSGIALLLDEPEKTGGLLTVHLNDLKLEAKVVYSQKKEDKFRVGLQFEKTDAELEVKLKDLIDKFSKGIPLMSYIEEENPKVIHD
jgi:GTP cyclohydrolase II